MYTRELSLTKNSKIWYTFEQFQTNSKRRSHCQLSILGQSSHDQLKFQVHKLTIRSHWIDYNQFTFNSNLSPAQLIICFLDNSRSTHVPSLACFCSAHVLFSIIYISTHFPSLFNPCSAIFPPLVSSRSAHIQMLINYISVHIPSVFHSCLAHFSSLVSSRSTHGPLLVNSNSTQIEYSVSSPSACISSLLSSRSTHVSIFWKV